MCTNLFMHRILQIWVLSFAQLITIVDPPSRSRSPSIRQPQEYMGQKKVTATTYNYTKCKNFQRGHHGLRRDSHAMCRSIHRHCISRYGLPKLFSRHKLAPKVRPDHFWPHSGNNKDAFRKQRGHQDFGCLITPYISTRCSWSHPLIQSNDIHHGPSWNIFLESRGMHRFGNYL